MQVVYDAASSLSGPGGIGVGYVESRGVRIAYDVRGAAGEALPLVLAHAFPLHRGMWLEVAEKLSVSRRVITVDLRGFGESGVAADGAMDRMAEDVRAVVLAESVGRAAIGGLSMGGYVAMAYLRRYPLDVAALVLSSTRATADTDAARAGRLALIEAVRARGTAAAVDALVPKLLAPETYGSRPDLADDVREMAAKADPEGVIAALTGMAVRSDSSELLAAVSLPMLVVAGTRDQLIPHAEVAAMAESIEGAELLSINAAGHLASLETPGAFVSAVADFLRRIDEGKT